MVERIKKGKGDIVFLLDVTVSMEKCLQAVKDNLITFASTLAGEVEKLGTVSKKIEPDIRYKVCGYRDQSCDGDKWFIDFPFVRNIDEVKTHMNHADMTHCGGGDEPESLLDALYKVGMMPLSGIQEPEDPNKWRRGVRHCILIFTDATFHKRATLPEIKDLDIFAVYEKIITSKIRLFGLVPEWEGYNLLGQFPYARMDYYIKGDLVKKLGEDSPEGAAAQIASADALEKLAKNEIFSSWRIARELTLSDSRYIKPDAVD